MIYMIYIMIYMIYMIYMIFMIFMIYMVFWVLASVVVHAFSGYVAPVLLASLSLIYIDIYAIVSRCLAQAHARLVLVRPISVIVLYAVHGMWAGVAACSPLFLEPPQRRRFGMRATPQLIRERLPIRSQPPHFNGNRVYHLVAVEV
jgi:hypothetical protein